MSRAINKFKMYAAIGTTKPKPAPSTPTGKAGESQMQKVASMLMHIIDRKSLLPDRHKGLPARLTKEIRDSFHIIDTDRDGLVSREQIQRLVYKIDPEMSDEEMLDLLDTADLDGDHMYDMDEYLFLMYLKWNDQESVDDIKEAFRVFDKDNSGSLSRLEFAFILRKLGEPLTDFEVDEILNHFDRDGSGEIDFDEFAYVMTGPHLDDDGADATGIPQTNGKSLNKLGPVRRIIASPVSRTKSARNLASLSELTLTEDEEIILPKFNPFKRKIKAEVVAEAHKSSPSLTDT